VFLDIGGAFRVTPPRRPTRSRGRIVGYWTLPRNGVRDLGERTSRSSRLIESAPAVNALAYLSSIAPEYFRSSLRTSGPFRSNFVRVALSARGISNGNRQDLGKRSPTRAWAQRRLWRALKGSSPSTARRRFRWSRNLVSAELPGVVLSAFEHRLDGPREPISRSAAGRSRTAYRRDTACREPSSW
jgi:hypothetical protein